MRTGRGWFTRALAAALVTAAAGPALGLAAGPAKPPKPAGPPACFGAAARDALHPCSNPKLRYSVTPTPDLAELQPSAYCPLAQTKGPPNRVCSFGAPKKGSLGTAALLGDSHAPAWRGAVDVLFKAEHLRGLTVRRSSCPFTFAARSVDKASADACFTWVQDSLRFFLHHPEIHTVFVIASSAYDYLPANGLDAHGAAVAGFRAAFQAMPASVTHIVVLHDNPQATDDTLPCVARALKHGQRADTRCALARGTALRPDAPTDAALQMASERVRSIDLTPFFCDDARCYTVVGGVLVYKDKSHITTTYGTTLGPYLVAAYRALGLPPG